MNINLNRWAAALALSLAAGAALAQAYPDKPIRFVVGFPPGGGNDIIARLVAAKMQEGLGQPVVIDNKPGANSIIATEFVAKAPADGYTLLVNATGGMSMNPVLYAKLPYDSLKDFAAISLLADFPMVMAVHPSVPANNVRELIAYAKANAGKLNYSSGSSSFQVAMEMFNQMAGTDIRHIPFKGSAASATAVLANTTQVTIIDTPAVVSQINAGRLRALAVTTTKRVPSMADIPTLDEAGVPGYDMLLWTGLFAPAGTPAAIVAKLAAEARRIMQLPDVREKIAAMGSQSIGSTPAELTETIKRQQAAYGPVVKARGIQVE